LEKKNHLINGVNAIVSRNLLKNEYKNKKEFDISELKDKFIGPQINPVKANLKQ